MAINANEDTEFNDALRKHGILPPREPTPPTPPSPPSPTLDDLLEDFTPSELQELADGAGNDEEERTIAAYRRQRIAKLQREERKARFGRVYPIGRDDYTREVTEASKVNEAGEEEEKGTGVVCFLYKDGIPRSDRAFEHIRSLASRYPRTKFVSIVGDKCIPNVPDSRLPMFIAYRKGDIRNQAVAWGADRERRLEELEALLLMCGAITPSDVHKPRGRDAQSDDEDDEDDPSSKMRSAAAMTNGQHARNIRGPTRAKSSDSDSDFDL